MGIADGLDNFTKQAQELQQQIKDPNAKLNENKLNQMVGFKENCEDQLMDYYAMDSTISTTKKKDEKIEAIQATEKKKSGLIR